MNDASPPSSELRQALLSITEEVLEAQLSAVRVLQGKSSARLARPRSPQRRKKGMSHIDMALDILAKAGEPLHASQLIQRMEAAFGLRVDSESLVSALSKRVARGDRFIRTAPNTFGLLESSHESQAR